jgi:DNA-directed RNA polymerase subunit RPC12/RpoP
MINLRGLIMAKKNAQQQTVNLKALIFKSPKNLMQGLTAATSGLQFTRVIQTYVFETTSIKLSLTKDGKSFFSGMVKWVGNKEDGTEGTVICVESGNELKLIVPNDDNTLDAIYEPEKSLITLQTTARTRCSVCGKGLEIFDLSSACPLCGSKAHSDHLVEWVKMRHNCPICKKELDLDANEHVKPK